MSWKIQVFCHSILYFCWNFAQEKPGFYTLKETIREHPFVDIGK